MNQTPLGVIERASFSRSLAYPDGPSLASFAKGGYSQEQPHVWQRRFYDFNVWSERKRVEELRYLHRNPVKRGLVLEPEYWEWSSYRSYAFQEEGKVKINQWPMG